MWKRAFFGATGIATAILGATLISKSITASREYHLALDRDPSLTQQVDQYSSLSRLKTSLEDISSNSDHPYVSEARSTTTRHLSEFSPQIEELIGSDLRVIATFLLALYLHASVV